INVGTVIELLPAEFAHPENAKFRRLPAPLAIEMIGLAEALGELAAADLIHGVQTDVGHVRNLARDFGGVAEAGQVTRRDAEHFPLFEQAESGQGGRVVARMEQWPQPAIDFATQPLFLARV